MIEQPSWRGDKDIDARPQRIMLLAIADSAKHHRDLQIGEPRKIANGGFHLGGEFAGRFQDQYARGALVMAQFGQDRQGKSRGLAGAGLRAADHILALKNQAE